MDANEHSLTVIIIMKLTCWSDFTTGLRKGNEEIAQIKFNLYNAIAVLTCQHITVTEGTLVYESLSVDKSPDLHYCIHILSQSWL